MSDRFERYLTNLRSVTGAEPELRTVESDMPTSDPSALDPVVAIVFRDVPEPGHITGFTYGLSLATHARWTTSRPELCISVRSDDVAWITEVAGMVSALRGRSAFRRGHVVCSAARLSTESEMRCFLLAGPVQLGRADPLIIDVGAAGAESSDVIEVIGIYPVYAAERDYIQRHGADSFWRLTWDRFDVHRGPLF